MKEMNWDESRAGRSGASEDKNSRTVVGHTSHMEELRVVR